jgi:hypothetical protein
MNRHWLAFAFSSLREPSGQSLGKAFRSEPETGFHSALRDRQRVIKIRGVGKVAHAELIEPFERASSGVSPDDDLYFEFLRVHKAKEAGPKPRLEVLS